MNPSPPTANHCRETRKPMIETDPEFLALMAACRDRPADDAPRLILSDWLEEHDEDAWAELIRVECEMERTRDEGRREALKARADTLIYLCWPAWFGGLIDILDRLPGGTWSRHDRTDYSQRDFELLRRTGPEYEQRRDGVDVDPRFPPDVLWSDRGLPALWLRWDSLRTPAVQAWFDSPQARRLWRTCALIGGRDDRLPDGPLGVSAGLRTSLALSLLIEEGYQRKTVLPPLTQPPDSDPRRPRQIKSIRDLLARLDGTNFGTQDFPSVAVLSIACNQDWPRLGRLRSTFDCSRLRRFSSSEYYGDVTTGLLRTQVFDSLEELNLHRIHHADLVDALAEAAEAGRMPQLQKLHATYRLGEDGYVRLLNTTLARTLTRVHFKSTGLTPTCLRMAIDCGLIDRMTRNAGRLPDGDTVALDLSDNPLGDDGGRLLAAEPVLARFARLDLSRTGLGDDGLTALLRSPYASSLRELDVSQNKITDAGADLLLASDMFNAPGAVWFYNNDISYVVERALQGKFSRQSDIEPSLRK